MQTVEILNEGLKRGYTLTIPASEISSRVDAELKSIAPQIRMPGFRPGKVPPNLVRKMHGAAIEQDMVGKAVREGVDSVIMDKKLRPAMRPAVEMKDDWQPGRDIELSIDVEVLPEIGETDIEGLKLERLTVEAGEAAVDEALARIAGQARRFEPAAKTRKAEIGDVVVVDFAGTIGGEAFEGGTGEGVSIELGSGQMIPGFEDQLVGAKAGDSKVVETKFPNDYQVERLRGKAARFDVTVSEVRVAGAAGEPNDDMAKALGLESLEQLRGILRDQANQELNGLTRTHMKRQLLDRLAATHDFPVPLSMVDAEFEQIWRQLDHEAGHEPDPEAARAEMETEREDYRRIAERRVRLGLLLSEIGQRNKIEIGRQEMSQLIAQAAQNFAPQDRERFIARVREDPMAAAQLRAPLYEDKVVDFLFDKAEITDRKATREELETAIEAEEGHVHGPGCGHDENEGGGENVAARKSTAKKTSKTAAAKTVATTKKPASTKASADRPAAKSAPAKKPVAKPASEAVTKSPAAKTPARKAAAISTKK